MFEVENTAVNNAYRNLMAAVVAQACNDYASLLQETKKDKKIKPHARPCYKFLIDNPYCDVLDIDGARLVHQMESNFKKYGKAILTDEQWDMISMFGKIVPSEKFKKAKEKEKKKKKEK